MKDNSKSEVANAVALDDLDLQDMLSAARLDVPSNADVNRLASRVAPLVGIAASTLGAGTAATGTVAAGASATTAAAAKVASTTTVAATGAVAGTAAKVAGMSVAAKLVVAAVAVTTVTVAGTAVWKERVHVAEERSAATARAHSDDVLAHRADVRSAHSAPTPAVVEQIQIPDTAVPTVAAPVAEVAHASGSEPRANVAHTTTAAQPAELLPAEITLLTGAQHELASNPTQALAIAAQHRALYPSGTFAQEREVIAIQALVQLGRMPEARTRATRFAHDYPASTHLRRIEVMLSGAVPQQK